MDSSCEPLISWTGYGSSERVAVKYVRIPVLMGGVADRGKSKIDFISSLQFCYQYDEYVHDVKIAIHKDEDASNS